CVILEALHHRSSHPTCNLASHVKATLSDEKRDSLTYRVPSSLALAFHPLRSAQLLGKLLATPQLVHFRLPVHAPSPFCPLSGIQRGGGAMVARSIRKRTRSGAAARRDGRP